MPTEPSYPLSRYVNVLAAPKSHVARLIFDDSEPHSDDEAVPLEAAAAKLNCPVGLLDAALSGRDRLLAVEMASSRLGISERSLWLYANGDAGSVMAAATKPVIRIPRFLVRWSERELRTLNVRALAAAEQRKETAKRGVHVV